MKRVIATASLFFLAVAPARAAVPVSAALNTDAPLFFGAGVAARFFEDFQASLQLGVLPGPYASLLGSVAASYGKPSYDDLVRTALDRNHLWRLGLEYRPGGNTGWHVGMAAYFLKTSGTGPVDAVLAATTGRDYTNLITALQNAGKSTDVSLEGSAFALQAFAGYGWQVGERLFLQGSAGVASIFSADVKLKTGLPAFEASQAGSRLLRTTEADLEKILNDYGWTPILAATLRYEF